MKITLENVLSRKENSVKRKPCKYKKYELISHNLFI